MMNDSPLQIHLLGPVEISSEGRSIQIRRRIERAILYILAGERLPVSRTTLIDLLWPEAEHADPRASLRTALSRLRNELPDPKILLTDLDQVWLDPQRCEIDVTLFENSFKSLSGFLIAYQPNRALPLEVVKQVKETLALWQGDTFIQGENLNAYSEVENWRRALDHRLRNHRQILMKRLAEHHQALGDLETALDLFLHINQSDMVDESIHRTVLNILNKLERYPEIIHYCDILEDYYENNYNAPLPEDILKQYQQSQYMKKAKEKQTRVEWPVPLTMNLQLVGRQVELDQLRKAYYQGGLALIQGEMGSGKTRLVRELFQTLSPKPVLFLAPANEMENTLPLAPIIQCLRQYMPEDIWHEIDCIWANQLSLLLPELSEKRSDCNPYQPSKLPTGKQHLFDALFHAFQKAAEKYGRVLFFLDDAQWADKQTIEVLSYLTFQGFFNQYGLLVITTRLEEPNQDLNDMVNQFYRSHTVHMLTLYGLNPSELSNLAQQALNQIPSPDFIKQLYSETGGNPFIALEIIRDLLEMGNHPENLDSISHLPLPASVRALIVRRLDKLTARSRQILTCAAVLGNSFSIGLLQSLAQITSLSELEALNPLIQSGFLYQSSDGNPHSDKLHFTHEILREVILKETTTAQLQILHRKAADQLAESPQSQTQAAIIANHYLAGGIIRNAFSWFLKSANHAWTLGAREDVLRDYQLAEGLFRNAPMEFINSTDVLQLYQQWCAFAYESNQFEMLEETAIKLQVLGEENNNTTMLGIAQLFLANACFLRLEFDTGRELIEKAVKYLESTDHREALIQALLRQGVFLWWKLNYDHAIALSKKVLTLLETCEATSPALISAEFNARHLRSMSYYAQGETHQALNGALDTYNRFYYKINPFDRIRTLNMLAYAHLISANYAKSQQYAREAIEMARALDNTFVEEILLVILSKAELTQGFLDRAYEHSQQALNLADQNNSTHTIVSANCLLGDIFSFLQNNNQALKHYRVAQVRAGFSFDFYSAIENNIRLARLLIRSDQLTEAKQILHKAIDVTQQKGMGQFNIHALLVKSTCDLVEKDIVSAEKHINRATQLADQKGLPYEKVWCKVAETRLALSRNQFDLAEELTIQIKNESLSRDMAWITLYAIGLCEQLQRGKTLHPALADYQIVRLSLIDKLKKYSRSGPLRQDFHNTSKLWEEGQNYP